jgi:2-dehydropantoate 2-reductase
VKVCVVGCGAVGSLFAANLAQLEDVEVWAYDASQPHVDAINANGLRLSGAGDVLGRVHATTDPSVLPPCDFGIVATKAMHTDAAVAATAHAFAGGCVATVQNGLGNEETIAAHVERVIRGTTFPAGKIVEPGHVQLVEVERPDLDVVEQRQVGREQRPDRPAPDHADPHSE